MRSDTRHWIGFAVAIGIVAVGATAIAAPLGTEFTYQGQLKDGGVPAAGNYDFVFRLYNDPNTGAQVGGDFPVDDWPVSDGVFTVQLDFGAAAFGSDARWLEVAVRPGADVNPHTDLSPRQPVTAAPVALYALDGPGSGGHWTLSGSDIYNNNSGDVGIGITAPESPLHVQDGSAGDATAWGSSIGAFESDGHGYLSILTPNSSERGIFFGDPESNISGGITYNNPALQDGFQFRTDGQVRMVIDNTGNIGIGMTSPAFPLHIQAAQPYIQYDDTGGGSSWLVGVQGPSVGFNIQELGAATRFVINDGGDVGIGDTSPIARLGVYKDEDDGRAALNATNAGTGSAGFFATTNTSNTSAALFAASSNSSAPALATLGDAIINGDATINGTATVDVLEITGADVAERFPVSEEVKPGMVMEIDPENAGKLRVSRGAYNRRVAGVVSGAGDMPIGTILGNLPGCEDAPPIALSGRVWVQCDASETAIEAGDLLTTAVEPGHAMAVRDHARAGGATIGKAMTCLARGETGMVLVLVNLQ